MTIKELEKLKSGRWDGSMKRKVVIEWRLGLLKYKEIVVTFPIGIPTEENQSSGV